MIRSKATQRDPDGHGLNTMEPQALPTCLVSLPVVRRLRKRVFLSKRVLIYGSLTLLLVAAARLSLAQVSVLTQHNDISRSGANLLETVLTPANVGVTTFGKLFTRNVDGQIYAQPLYLPRVVVNGATVNIVYVATENNTVYAFDADNPGATAPLWSKNFGVPVPTSAICSTDTYPQIGITSTPVIDTASNRMYVVAKTTEPDGTYAQRLHVLDINTGQVIASVVISASVPGTGIDAVNQTVTFDALHQLNRPGLLLYAGYVYLAFGSHCDSDPYHGWVLAYSTSNLATPPLVWNITPNGTRAGIWQGGQGLAADGTGIYLMSGNGTFDRNIGGPDLGDSFVRLTSSLSIADYFTPHDQATLDQGDLDLGSTGPLLLPSPLPGTSLNLLIGGGKAGVLYLINRASMGSYNSATDNVVQSFAASSGPLFGSPIFWNGPNAQYLYVWAGSDSLKQFAWNSSSGIFQPTPIANNGRTASLPGGALSLSANGSSKGILWATTPYQNAANHATVPGILRAYDAANVATELWNSYQNQGRDDFGNLAKFCPVTVANGKVYVATFSNVLAVYGLLSTADPLAPSGPGNLVATLTPGATASSVTLTWNASTDNDGGTGVAGYNVYRTNQGNTVQVSQTSALTFTDTKLATNTNYAYFVKAFDNVGNLSAPSNTARTKTTK